MKTNETPKLRLDRLPRMPRTISVASGIVLTDNLDQPMPAGIEEALAAHRPTREMSPANLTFPFRVLFNTIIFVTGGEVCCRIDLREIRIPPDSLFLAPAGIIIDAIRFPVGTRSLILAYTDESPLGTLRTPSARMIRNATLQPLVIPFRRDRMERYLQTFRLILHVIETPDNPFKQEIIEGFTEVISGSIAKVLLEQQAQRQERDWNDTLLHAFQTLVLQHCRSHRDLSFYADKLCMSPKYLSRQIAETAGRNASAIIRDHVILEAKVLLRAGEYNVQQVSNLLDFPNASFFGRYFKDATGMTPRQYRLRGGD